MTRRPAARAQSFQRRLLAHSVPSGSQPERRLVSTAAVADSLGVTEAVASVLLCVLDAAAPEPGAAVGGVPAEGDMHSVLMLLFVNMYARPHVQSSLRNAGDVWPQGAPGVGSPAGGAAAPGAEAPAGAGKPGPASPTKPRRALGGAGADDEALQVSFVLRNLAQLLPLLRSTPAAGAAGCVVAAACARAARQPRLRADAPAARGPAACAPATRCAARSADVQLSSAEFDRIGFLFAVAAHPPGCVVRAPAPSVPRGGTRALHPARPAAALTRPRPLSRSTRLSDVAPAFAGGVQKSIALPAARDWLSRAVLTPAPGAPPRAGDAAVECVARTTLLLREPDVGPLGALRVSDCHEALIYVLAPCGLASVSHCTDCTVVVGAAARCLRLEQCERCTVVAAARSVQLRSCRGGVLHLAVARPTLVLGDTRGVRVAPFNTHYDALSAHLAAAGLSPAAPNCWEQCATLAPVPQPGAAVAAAAAGGAAAPKSPLAPLPPDDFCPFVVPFGAAEGALPPGRPATTANPFALPEAYASATEAKVRRVGELQAAVREAALDEGRRRELQGAIQAHFREWLVASGNMRQILELANRF